jgi:hypothetical protein
MRKLIRKILRESHDMGWIENIASDYHPQKLEIGIKGLEKWKGEAYEVDDDIGLAIENVKENPSKETIMDLLNTVKQWKGMAYQDGDDFYWALEDIMLSINPYFFKHLHNLDESYDLQWMEDVGPMSLGPHDEPKEGEKLICIPGFSIIPYSDNYGGAGYEEGKIITVENVSKHKDHNVVWPNDDSGKGVFANALGRL